MRQSSQAGFNPAQNNGRLFIGLTYQIAVYDHRTIRATSHLAARRIRILLSVFFGHCIMVYHGIHVTR